jgi:hypothetical protein
MSAPHHFLLRQLDLGAKPAPKKSPIDIRPSIGDRFASLLQEIESFLLVCSYEELCSFWEAIADLREYPPKVTTRLEVPQFLNTRKKQRNFCRILEVLADLPYPKLSLSHRNQPPTQKYAK